MNKFAPGQRWISEAENQLGLGTVLEVAHRRVTIVFLASGETRTYSQDNAPLARLQFTTGDRIKSHEGWEMTVSRVEEVDATYTYHGKRDDGSVVSLHENDLDNFIRLNRPLDRGLTGQLDSSKRYKLRMETIRQRFRTGIHPAWGLSGARTDILPHQIYIADEVSSRYAPRVLLADEVGLGKTIEAGMIIHRQLLQGRARRVLICVPESLVHQWLVEMLRRFNLHFSIFDEARCEAECESDNVENPFESAQLVLCSVDFLRDHPQRHTQLLASHWDLLVVDEAHRLQWLPEQPSIEYQLIEQLTAAIKGVLLLTATPEQLGRESHFARLRLLDPHRFSEYAQFLEMEHQYQPIADIVDRLFAHNALSDEQLHYLQDKLHQSQLDALGDSDTDDYDILTRQVINGLLDQHGTGRILFRNTRQAVKGFPERKLHSYPLEAPAQYQALLNSDAAAELNVPGLLLAPERLFRLLHEAEADSWTEFDPRVNWLCEQIKLHKTDKLLVIAANKKTVLQLADALRVQQGIHAAVFHEDMSIVERDRAAAWFADEEYGAQVLICSEIGSEGRNFQFAHHLLMFDLPFNPDLLEQRIGRLDRIGQRETVNIHVPYFSNTAQEVMLQWYHRGLNAFELSCPAAANIFAELNNALVASFAGTDSMALAGGLIDTSAALAAELNEEMAQGRDRLIEFNSCRDDRAAQVSQAVNDLSDAESLRTYMESVFDCFGVEIEDHIQHTYILRPGPKMQGDYFPGIGEDGLTVTYDRQTALVHEDIQFLSWEHPIVISAMDLVLSHETGNMNVVALKSPKGIKAGSMLVECTFQAELPQESSITWLPPLTARLLLDNTGRVLTDNLPATWLDKHVQNIERNVAKQIITMQADSLRGLIRQAESLADAEVAHSIEAFSQAASTRYQQEIQRLVNLKRINPAIRDDEIEFFQHELEQVHGLLAAAKPRLDALRVVITV